MTADNRYQDRRIAVFRGWGRGDQFGNEEKFVFHMGYERESVQASVDHHRPHYRETGIDESEEWLSKHPNAFWAKYEYGDGGQVVVLPGLPMRGLTAEGLAETICALNDEEQAQILIEIVEIAEKTPIGRRQWQRLGKHLADCVCSNDGVRNILRDIVDACEAERARMAAAGEVATTTTGVR